MPPRRGRRIDRAARFRHLIGMVTILDRSAPLDRPRHPEKAGRPETPLLRKPEWIRVRAPGSPVYRQTRDIVRQHGLVTVCEEAACPNIGECWERGTATFMILGDTCTRRCGFCHVMTGTPTWNDPLEPARVARSISMMGLRHAVVTSVDRDDLPDYGSRIWAATINQIRRQSPDTKIETLTPDFRGEEMPLATVINAGPDVFNHNVETVPRLYPVARRGSEFLRSARVLRNAKAMGGGAVPGVDRRQGGQRLLQRSAAVQDGGQKVEGGFAGWVRHARVHAVSPPDRQARWPPWDPPGGPMGIPSDRTAGVFGRSRAANGGNSHAQIRQ